jgi:hypothetical protein
MTAEQKFVWWLKGFLDSNPDVSFERIKEELDKVTRETVTAPFSFITTTGTPSGSAANIPDAFKVPFPYPTYPKSPFTFSTLDGK